jgi:hypothetical protein
MIDGAGEFNVQRPDQRLRREEAKGKACPPLTDINLGSVCFMLYDASPEVVDSWRQTSKLNC